MLGFASVLAARRFWAGRRRTPPCFVDDVTILKPLHGAEPGLYENLSSFVEQDYPGRVQIVFGVASEDDGAVPIVRRLMAEHPERDLQLVVGVGPFPGNGKIVNLIAMSGTIRHDHVVLSDSDMRVERDYLAQVTAPLAEPGVGLVTCLYRGEAHGGLWATLSAMGIDYHFLPLVLLGLYLRKGRPCLGATMAFSRRTLDAIGGFAAFTRCLADDYAIGEAVRATGQRVVMCSQVIVHRCTERNLTDLFHHEVRWARTLRSISPYGYAGSVATNPLPFALLGAMTGDMVPGVEWFGVAVLGVTILSRTMLHWRVERALGISTARWMLSPARDVLSFAVFCSSFLGTNVVWRGHRYGIDGNGTLTDLKGSRS